MLSCVFSGFPAPELRLRESPTRASLGRTTIRSCPSGECVSSFFDIFTELSVDGGATYEPACSPVRVESSLSRACRSRPRPPRSHSARLVSQPIELEPRLKSAAPCCAARTPARGSASGGFILGENRYRHHGFPLSVDNGATAGRVSGDVFMRYEMKEVVVSSYCTSFDTEMLQLEVSGASCPAGNVRP